MATPPDTSCLANLRCRYATTSTPAHYKHQTSSHRLIFPQLPCAISEMQTRWWDKPAGLPYRRKRFETSRPWRFGGGANRQVCPTSAGVSELRGHGDSVVGQTDRFALPGQEFRCSALRGQGGGPALATSGHQLVPYPMHGDQVLRLAAVVAQLSSQLHDHLIQCASGAVIIVAPNLV